MIQVRQTSLLISAALLASVAAQDPTGGSQFRTGVQLVYVDVAVSERDGRPLVDLRLTDFELFEDGKPAKVEFLRWAHASTLSSIEGPARPSDLSAVNLSNAELSGGRVLALVLDANQIGFRPRPASRTREIGNLIVDGLSPADYAAVITLGGQTAQQSDFTRDKAQLKAAISRFRPTAGGSLGMRTTAEQFEEVTRAHEAVASVGNLVDALASVQDRRKGVVLVSEGIPVDVIEPQAREGPYSRELRSALLALVEQAKQANVSVYTFHPGEMRAPPTSGQRSLEWLSEQTGGLAAANTNTVRPEVATLLQDTGTYYLLGYYSAAPLDGKFHRIDVKVRRPGVRVRARQGFVSQRPATLTSLDAAIRGPLPITDLPLRVVGVPVPVAGEPGAGVAVGIELRGGPAVEAADHEVLTLATNMRGHVKAEDRLRIHTNGMWAGDARDRIRFASHLRLRPGRYMLRVAVRRLQDGAIGTVSAQIEVPRFHKNLAVSALGVSARGAPDNQPPSERRSLLAGIPIATDNLSPEEQVDTLLKVIVSRNKSNHPASVDFVASLTDRQGNTQEIDRTSRSADQFIGPAGGTYRLPLPALRAGSYLLSIVAALPSGATERRTAALVVR